MSPVVVWPTAADVPPSPFPVRARWPRGAVPAPSGRHRRLEPDEAPTVRFLFTHPPMLAGTDNPGGTL
jgi:hypothetical protein